MRKPLCPWCNTNTATNQPTPQNVSLSGRQAEGLGECSWYTRSRWSLAAPSSLLQPTPWSVLDTVVSATVLVLVDLAILIAMAVS